MHFKMDPFPLKYEILFGSMLSLDGIQSISLVEITVYLSKTDPFSLVEIIVYLS